MAHGLLQLLQALNSLIQGWQGFIEISLGIVLSGSNSQLRLGDRMGE
jgi:hypothetical protein